MRLYISHRPKIWERMCSQMLVKSTKSPNISVKLKHNLNLKSCWIMKYSFITQDLREKTLENPYVPNWKITRLRRIGMIRTRFQLFENIRYTLSLNLNCEYILIGQGLVIWLPQSRKTFLTNSKSSFSQNMELNEY